MRIGLIAEFNPLHSGHEYLINQAKNLIEEYKSGELICVMSEFFTQRGEIAVINPYSRAKAAINAGCDLVLALPYRASLAYSDDFARYSLDILIKSGITHLIFGTDYNIEDFDRLYIEEGNKQDQIKELIKKGLSYPKIMQEVLDIPKDSPNFILAYSYYKVIKEKAPHIEIIAINREGQKLNDNKLEEKKYLSATSIRNNIEDTFVNNYMSPTMQEELAKHKKLNEEDFFQLIKYKVLSMGTDNLKEIYDVREGLENRIYKAALESNNHKELIDNIVSKRYTRKRIARILIHILTSSTREAMLKDIEHVRVLAVKKDKTSLIRDINNREAILLHQKLKKHNEEIFEHDIRAARIYQFLSGDQDIFKYNIEIIGE
ncbi:MAG: nucleotidyltransferase family protein [Gemella sp.]|nr:nucleotidyltransferase family protein [Gemella sp.]